MIHRLAKQWFFLWKTTCFVFLVSIARDLLHPFPRRHMEKFTFLLHFFCLLKPFWFFYAIIYYRLSQRIFKLSNVLKGAELEAFLVWLVNPKIFLYSAGFSSDWHLLKKEFRLPLIINVIWDSQLHHTDLYCTMSIYFILPRW